jgi:hypothetical protein
MLIRLNFNAACCEQAVAQAARSTDQFAACRARLPYLYIDLTPLCARTTIPFWLSAPLLGNRVARN